MFEQSQACHVPLAPLRHLLLNWDTHLQDTDRTMIRLRELFDRHFHLAPLDHVNITEAQWAQVVLRIESVRTLQGPWGPLGGDERALVVCAWGDVPEHGRHCVDVCLPVMMLFIGT